MQIADLQAKQVAKMYAGLPAVDHLSFEVARGSFFSILGPSGCGKTTLLRMIAGFLAPDSGDIVIGGASMQDVPPNRRPVNMVFQHLALFPMMSVGENVGYGLVRRGLAKAEVKRRVGEMLERVSLGGSEAKRVDQLSGGQKQRVAIARSLVLEPTLLLLDEPLGALDLKLREHMKIELKQLQAAFGTTFVYITHDQSEALVLSDRVAVMNKGRFEQVGSPQSLYYEPDTPFVAGFVGANNKLQGQVAAVNGDTVEVLCAGGLRLFGRKKSDLQAGDAVQVFIRPEAIALSTGEGVADAQTVRYSSTVQSVLFDGANSAVLLTEAQSGKELQVALPQTGQFSNLSAGDKVSFAFDPKQAIVFAAGTS
jgi:spermidine/putrescine transport system ATP-binding protein